ncbi:MAG: hypothetical protein COW30_12210 [Rhodospirillales bacterium CG15_BIG_FIL_POST_REV_8_21_14_020_66_15]|nr:MAG: hypothetical protein COW30_12210 [Rhodospirillales bacterium CG15_BIG_FIL_POST_REV_8_21_14_020_66_15]
MFGFSLPKLLFTALAIAAVWYGFKWLGRVQARQKELARERARRMKDTGTPRGRAPEVEDMMECPTCGAFVAASGPRNCGKTDCPYPE